jgi:hypothetical protein
MTSYDFTPVEVPTGTYISWGPKPEQIVTIDVISYTPHGGTDFHDQPCPQIVGTLVADCATYRDKGATKERLTAGPMVTLNCGLANLKRNVLAADPQPGDIIRLTFESTTPGAKGDIKLFKAEVARGAGTGKATVDVSSGADAAPTGGDFLDDI